MIQYTHKTKRSFEKMIEFEINSEKNSKIDLLSLYAICGEDEDRKTRLLVIGYLDYSSKVPVTDLTSPLHSCRLI